SNIKSKAKIHNREELDKVMDNVVQRKYYFKQLEWLDEGRQEGMQKGMEKGIQKGITVGIEKGIQTIIEKLKQGGMSEQEIEKLLS
ncbi:MAG: hypothetical protein FWH05_04725, partial [Oscillospiraceae bacterium]|nr:hypothetical protein [Oscillospiraceae bacterium]